jgi:sulfur-oxidizing protein SoxY
MKSTRRTLLKLVGWALLAGLAQPIRLLAAQWNKAAFEARNVDDALRGMGIASVTETTQIRLKVPEIAENGSIVPIEIASEIPDTQAIYIVVDKNTQPMVGCFEFGPEAVAFVATRIKMTESSRVRFIVRAGGAFLGTSREIKVTIGGCGA